MHLREATDADTIECPGCGTNGVQPCPDCHGGATIRTTRCRCEPDRVTGKPAAVPCRICGGAGAIPPDQVVRCGVCLGDGEAYAYCRQCVGTSPGYRCGTCGDAGMIATRCRACDGTGEVEAADYSEGEA